MISSAGIPAIPGDMDALAGHATSISTAGTQFAATGDRVHSTWQGLAASYRAPEAEQLFAATLPVQMVSSTVGADLGVAGSALSTYAAEVKAIQAALEALRAQAVEFEAFAKAHEGWRDDQANVDRDQALVDGVADQMAAFLDAQRRCANALRALYGAPPLQVDNGDGVIVAGTEFGYTAEQLLAAGHQEGAVPWGFADDRDLAWYEEIGHFFVGIGDAGVDLFVGLGSLVDYSDGNWSWDTAGTAWAGVGKLVTAVAVYGSGPLGQMADQQGWIPGLQRGELGQTLRTRARRSSPTTSGARTPRAPPGTPSATSSPPWSAPKAQAPRSRSPAPRSRAPAPQALSPGSAGASPRPVARCRPSRRSTSSPSAPPAGCPASGCRHWPVGWTSTSAAAATSPTPVLQSGSRTRRWSLRRAGASPTPSGPRRGWTRARPDRRRLPTASRRRLARPRQRTAADRPLQRRRLTDLRPRHLPRMPSTHLCGPARTTAPPQATAFWSPSAPGRRPVPRTPPAPGAATSHRRRHITMARQRPAAAHQMGATARRPQPGLHRTVAMARPPRLTPTDRTRQPIRVAPMTDSTPARRTAPILPTTRLFTTNWTQPEPTARMRSRLIRRQHPLLVQVSEAWAPFWRAVSHAARTA